MVIEKYMLSLTVNTIETGSNNKLNNLLIPGVARSKVEVQLWFDEKSSKKFNLKFKYE